MRRDLRRQGHWATQRKTCSRGRLVSPSVSSWVRVRLSPPRRLALGENLFQSKRDAGTVLRDRHAPHGGGCGLSILHDVSPKVEASLVSTRTRRFGGKDVPQSG